MSKADNKELEEAINYVEELIEQFYEFPNPESVEIKDKEIGNIETILKELKRLQEENSKLERANKTYINSIQSITPVLLEDYIEKDKIREKIEELIKKLDKIYNSHGASDYDFIKIEAKIQVLEELLEGK